MPTLTDEQRLRVELDEAWQMFCEADQNTMAYVATLSAADLARLRLAFQNGYAIGGRNALHQLREDQKQ